MPKKQLLYLLVLSVNLTSAAAPGVATHRYDAGASLYTKQEVAYAVCGVVFGGLCVYLYDQQVLKELKALRSSAAGSQSTPVVPRVRLYGGASSRVPVSGLAPTSTFLSPRSPTPGSSELSTSRPPVSAPSMLTIPRVLSESKSTQTDPESKLTTESQTSFELVASGVTSQSTQTSPDLSLGDGSQYVTPGLSVSAPQRPTVQSRSESYNEDVWRLAGIMSNGRCGDDGVKGALMELGDCQRLCAMIAGNVSTSGLPEVLVSAIDAIKRLNAGGAVVAQEEFQSLATTMGISNKLMFELTANFGLSRTLRETDEIFVDDLSNESRCVAEFEYQVLDALGMVRAQWQVVVKDSTTAQPTAREKKPQTKAGESMVDDAVKKIRVLYESVLEKKDDGNWYDSVLEYVGQVKRGVDQDGYIVFNIVEWLRGVKFTNEVVSKQQVEKLYGGVAGLSEDAGDVTTKGKGTPPPPPKGKGTPPPPPKGKGTPPPPPKGKGTPGKGASPNDSGRDKGVYVCHRPLMPLLWFGPESKAALEELLQAVDKWNEYASAVKRSRFPSDDGLKAGIEGKAQAVQAKAKVVIQDYTWPEFDRERRDDSEYVQQYFKLDEYRERKDTVLGMLIQLSEDLQRYKSK